MGALARGPATTPQAASSRRRAGRAAPVQHTASGRPGHPQPPRRAGARAMPAPARGPSGRVRDRLQGAAVLVVEGLVEEEDLLGRDPQGEQLAAEALEGLPVEAAA